MATPSTALTSISWPDRSLLDEAKREAEELGLNFSVYITQIVRRHLRQRAPLDVLTDRDGPGRVRYTAPKPQAALVAEEPMKMTLEEANQAALKKAAEIARQPRILRKAKL